MGKKSLVFFFPNPCAGIRQTLSSQRNSVVYKKGQYMDTLFRAVLWIVAGVGGLLLLATVLGVSSGQIGVMIRVISFMGFIILGLHLSFVYYKYVKKKDLLTAAPGKEGRF
jgi:hypothetical protein